MEDENAIIYCKKIVMNARIGGNIKNMNDILKDNNNANYIKKISAYEQFKNKNIDNDLIGFYYQFNHSHYSNPNLSLKDLRKLLEI